jgi:hypothetical protein
MSMYESKNGEREFSRVCVRERQDNKKASKRMQKRRKERRSEWGGTQPNFPHT